MENQTPTTIAKETKMHQKKTEKIKMSRRFKIGVFKTRDMFKLIKTTPFKLKYRCNVEETPLSLDEQREYIKDRTEEIERIKAEIFPKLLKIPIDVESEKKLRSKLKKKGITHFIDPQFPPNDSSIYCKEIEEYPFKHIVHWRRPHEIMSEPQMFEDDIDPSDIKQGIIPNCWLLSACACLAERPSLIRRLFITDEYNEEGIYRLRILKNGEWHLVTIDDYIPCYYNGGPMFTRSNGMELWVMLLEKAFAKLHGNYHCLEYGYTYEAMIDLTGCPTTYFNLTDKNSVDLENYEEKDKFWNLIKKYDDHGYLISGETSGFDAYSKGGGLSGGGLVPGHAYSVIRLVEVEGNRLINIYNPWGRFEWDGAWNDNDSRWTKNIKDIVQPTLRDNDGLFWMCFDDFCERFSSMNVCQLRNWEEIRVRGKFLKVDDINGDENNDNVISKFYYEVHVTRKTKIIFSIHQEDQRIVGSCKRPQNDVGFIILKADSDNIGSFSTYAVSNLNRQREVQQEVTLNEGVFIFMPLTTGCMLQEPRVVQHTKIDPYIVNSDGTMSYHPFIKSTFADIYDKFDLTGDGVLCTEELNQFGKIANLRFFKDLTQEDFKTNKMRQYSCTSEGLTAMGFYQIIMRKYGIDKIVRKLRRFGINKNLYSIKSSIFMISLHSALPVKVIARDALVTDLNERCWDMYIDYMIKNNPENIETIKKQSEFELNRVKHKEVDAASYFFINKTNGDLTVNLDMTDSLSCYYSPVSGKFTCTIEAGVMKYLCSSMADPEKDSYLFESKLEVNDINGNSVIKSAGLFGWGWGWGAANSNYEQTYEQSQNDYQNDEDEEENNDYED